MNHLVSVMAVIISNSCVLDNPLRRTLLRDVRHSFEINCRTINQLDSRSSIGLFKLVSADVSSCILSCLLTTVHHYQGLHYIEMRTYGVTVWVFRLYLLYIKKPILYAYVCVCMYICMYVCMYVCVCMYVFMYVCMYYVCVCLCLCIYVCMYVCVYVLCMYVCVYVCMRACTHVCM